MSALRRLLVLILIALAGVMMWAPPAPAQEAGGEAITGTLTYDDPDSGEKVPAEGVTVTVTGGGEAVTDGEGKFTIAVDGPGDYEVSIDITTLPEGVTLRDPERATVTKTLDPGQSGPVLFALTAGGEDAGGSSGGGGVSGRRVAQLTVEGLKQGLYLAMAAIGLSLIYGTTGLTNFAHAEMVTWGGLMTYFMNKWGFAGIFGFMASWVAPFGGGVNLIFAAIFGIFMGGVFGWFLNRFLFRSFRRAGVGLMSQMVITIGLSILIRYIFLYNWGGSSRTFVDYSTQTAWDIGPVDITPKDLLAMSLAVVLLVGVGLFLQLSRWGKAMRAVADNRDLAESSGIDVERVISLVWIAGGALAATGGVFFGLDKIRWDFGAQILLLIFAAVTLGGLGTAYGALVGSLIVGLTVNLSQLFIDAELKNMMALLVLVLILLFRPQGILGRPERIG